MFDSTRTHFELMVTYRYSVDGLEFIGKRLRVGGKRYQSESSALKDLNQFKEGQSVSFYYNPKQPNQSVLIRG